MVRPLRIELAGGIYHVTSRGDRLEAIYRDDQDRADWLALLGDVCRRFNWRCHAYCEMSNHYHCVVETVEANLSKGMRQLNGVYTQRFNRRHGLQGHLFQGRFKAILVERDTYLLELTRYVVLNPVRAGMVATVSAWRWSSYGAVIGLDNAPPWLETGWVLNQFGHDLLRARKRYANFVSEGVKQPSVWEDLRHEIFLGSDQFVEQFRDTAKPLENLREVPRTQRRPLAKPLAHFEHMYPDRREAMAHAFRTGVYTMQEIADHFRVHYSTVSRAVHRFEVNDNLKSVPTG